ncbi:MAG: cation-transporting P-type ATPase [Candidatus Caldarchaeum sp.]
MEEVPDLLKTSRAGLESKEAEERLTYGYNETVKKKHIFMFSSDSSKTRSSMF